MSISERIEEARVNGEEVISLKDSFMGDEGCCLLVKSLGAEQRVKRLDLGGCNIRSEGAIALASLLSFSHTLTSLSLEWNGIGMLESAFVTFCRALSSNRSLLELDLRNNNIGGAGGAALGDMLAKNSVMRKLDIRWNSLGMKGGAALVIGLQENQSLIQLDVSGNKITDESLSKIQQVINKNRQLLSQSDTSEEAARGEGERIGEEERKREGGNASLNDALVRETFKDLQEAHKLSERIFTEEEERKERTTRSVHLDDHVDKKLVDMSRSMLEYKELYLHTERSVEEEQRQRLEAEERLRECEAVIEMVKTQAREQEERRNRERREQEEELKRERSQRQEQEQLVHSLRQQLEEEKRRRDEALRSSSCENEMMGAEKKRLLEQIDVLKASVKSLKEKLSAQQLEAQSSQRKLMEQRSEAEHKMKLEHQDHLSHKESELIDMSAAHARQLKMLQDQLDKTNSEKVKLEIDMRKIKSELQDVLIRHEEEISQIKESCRREEDGRIAYLDEKISSIQQARELQQQRSDQLALELAELRKLENYRLKEHDNLLKQEVEHRLEVEKVAEARQTELEGLRIENMRLKHKLMAAEEGMQRSEEELRANTQQQERTIKELLETDGMRSRQLEEEIRSARNRISSLETELRKKEIDQSRAREEEVVRMSRLQERILEKVREELMNLS